MVEKVLNRNIRLVLGLCSSYIKSMSEWYWSFMLAIYLLILFAMILVSLVFFGGSVLTNFYIELFSILLAVHVYMGFKAVIHDYIYNRYIVRLCTNMSLLVVIAVLVEILKS